MATTGTTNYSRTILILGRGGTKLTRRYLEKRVKDLSPEGHELSIDEFLLTHKTGILEKPTGKHNEKFFFPTSPTKTDLAKWDLCMFCFILTETCDLSTTLRMYVKKLQKLRNKLCHMNDASLEESRYEEYMEKIDCCFKKCLDEIDDADFSKEMDDLVKSLRDGSLALDDTVRFMHTFYKTDTEQKQILEKHSKDHEELDNKFDKMMLKLESIDSRMQEGSSVDIPAVPIVIEVKNCTDDKEAEVLEFLVKRLNELINQKESGLEEDIPNGVLHKIREILQQTLKDLFVQGRHIIKVEQKCILLQIKCTSLASLISLLRDYRSGQLTRQLHGLQMAIRLFSGCKDAELDTIIYQDTFWKVMDELVVNLEERVQRQQYALHPVRSHMELNNGRSLTDLNGSRINGLGDARYAVNTLPDNRTGESNSVRIYVQTATHSDQEQLKEYFETGVIDQGMKLLQEEIGQQLHISNVSITARLVQGGFDKNDERQIDLPNLPQEHTTWGNVDGSNAAEEIDSAAYLQHERVQDISRSDENFENQCSPEGSESSQGHDAVLKEKGNGINVQTESTDTAVYTSGSSKVEKIYQRSLDDDAEEVPEYLSLKKNAESEEFQTDFYSQSKEEKSYTDELIYLGNTSKFDGDQKRAEEFAFQATTIVDQEKEMLLTGSESATSDEQLTDWYKECCSLLFLLGKTKLATRCYYTAMVFDPEWDYDEHLYLSDMLWGKLVFYRWTSTLEEICQDVEPLLKELDNLAKLAENRQRWSVSVAIDSDIETIYYFLNKLQRLRLMAFDIIKQPGRKDAFKRMGRCYLNMGLHHDTRKTCITILQDMCDYNDADALEIWARSLFETEDFELASDKCDLALKYCQNDTSAERLKIFQEEIKKKLEEKRTPQTNTPDDEWLQGTHANSMATSVTRKMPEKQKKKRRRPKARDHSEQTQTLRGTVSVEKEAGTFDHDKQILRADELQSSEDKHRCSAIPNTLRECNIATNTAEYSIMESESDNDTSTLMDETLSIGERENDENFNSVSSYYEESLQNRKNISPTETLLKEGVYLRQSYLKQFEDKHADVLKRNPFYNELLPKDSLKKKIASCPEKYVRCVIQFETSHEAYCKPVDSNKFINLIEISGRSKIGCEVFNEDEVVVEILDDHEMKEKRYGKVIGVWNRKRHKDIKHPVFLCTLDDMESHLVRPMCKTVPKIHVLTKKISQEFSTKRERAYKLELYEYDAGKGCFCNPQIREINPADHSSYILAVAYIQWGTRHIYPRGAVIDILPKVNSVSTGLKILNLQYEIPSLYDSATTETVEGLLQTSGDGLGQHMLEGRKDLTGMNIFTVHHAGVVDLYNAFSIEEVENGYKIGLHVSDVSAFVQTGSSLDKEACRRATTFDSGVGKKRHMLPEPLSEDICSLLPDKERLTISIFLLIATNGKQMQVENRNYEILLSYIKSKRHLTYEDAEEVLASREKDDGVLADMKKLFHVSCKMKKHRLQYASDASDLEYIEELKLSESITESAKTKTMVEEILIMANKKMTQHLLGIYGNCIPLLYIPPPSDEAIEDFLKKADKYTDIVLNLQNTRIGSKVPSFSECVGQKTNRSVSLSKHVWELISKTPKKAAKYIQKDDHHPIQLVTAIGWLTIKNQAEYIPSGTLKTAGSDKKAYTRFTSPIQSFMDIIVQRFIHAAETNKITCPYKKEDIEHICVHVNSVRKREREYKKACHILHLATKLHKSPVMVNAFVNTVSDSGVTLLSSLLKHAPNPEMDLAFNLLDVDVKPEVTEDKITHWKKVHAVWKKRLYDIHVHTQIADDRGYELKLDCHKDVVFIPLHEWARILKYSVEERVDDLSRAINHANVSNPTEGLDDVSMECFNSLDLKPNTKFSMTFSRCQMLKVQVSAEPNRGMLSPKLMLYNMTNNVKFCLQHPDDPVLHLFRYATRTSCDQYKNVHEYLERWIPIMLMESSTGAVRNEENFCINSVPVRFSGKSGSFALGLPECEVRNIEFSGTQSDDEDEDDISAGMPCYDWLCLKSAVPKMTKTQSLDSIWVGHAEISKVRRKKDAQPNGKLEVSFLLHKRANNLPRSPIFSDAGTKCSVEVLRKLEVDRRTESFIKMLPKLKESLATKIALNKPMPGLDKSRQHIASLIENDIYYDVSSEDLRRKALPRNNTKQQEAIDKALNSTFSLIQGPPGTGKTNTGIKLICLFDKINHILHKEGKQRKQVLFCGPSNKSVDLVAVWMLNRMGNHRPNFVRVYGRSIETIDFPVPGRTFQSRKSSRNQRAAPVLYQVALHHLIRQKGKKHAEEINKMDKMFKASNYAPMPVQVKKYVHLVREASIDEIRKHDVILCTTAVGSNPKVLSAASVYQVIVDEAGMCPEPQCLVPIIATKAEQVVLIGDHKQLRPIVMCKAAASLGLETSLFERYALTKSSKNVRFTMLEEQYRMHPQICSFPSEQFYQNQLKTRRGLWDGRDGRNLDIWPKEGYPFVFVHVEGHEEMLTVSTEDGNEQSKSNAEEIDHVIKVYSYLTEKMHHHKDSIQILSQYNAQCSEIRRKLQRKGFSDDNVSTVVSSQGGEWDYVIFTTVRSLPDYKIERNPTIGWCQHNLGFITDKNQINVALTRARKGLIIIGNRKLLECDSVWKKLIEHYEGHGCIMKPDQFPPSDVSRQSFDTHGKYRDSVTYIGASLRKGRPMRLRKY